ncbi:hypothetical protein BB559_006578 [Furculomyces boomerangus]|uniref:Uncharacterized protein n=2 Tax=Harpellales TaxID=61421 RepID=A0A2T9Y1S2_9FUNG|nr:hypothetical protein BB559_006578 [Furculomyces boomerangus]PVZ99364.1 hypothetical protein BB558_004618 [Smittium angustum]
MAKTDAKLIKAINIIKDAIIDDLVKQFEDFEFEGNQDHVLTIEEVITILKHNETRLPTKEKKAPKVKDEKKVRKIKEENRCTRTTKAGQRCGAPRSSSSSCWGHMSPDEREEYKSAKE